jgi:hypothetical protein
VTGIYYTDILDVLRAAGCTVAESSTTNGWQRRARSSGGFPSAPLGVQWHHTASSTSPANDLHWQIVACQDSPVGNMLLDRTGTFWPVAAGAANTAGKGGPLAMSRGTIPLDSANTRTWAIEAANNGVGEAWPTAQIDAYFRASNALNARFGNAPGDVFNHNTWAPTRKIDPATSSAVQGAWCPASSTSSGTWRQSDVTAECQRRAAGAPGPRPPMPGGDDVIPQVMKGDASDTYWAWDGVVCGGIPSLEWVQWGYEAGLYQNTDPVVYPQGFVDQLVAAQSQR